MADRRSDVIGQGPFPPGGAALALHADLAARLSAMQRRLNAEGFAVLRITGAGLPRKRRLVRIMPVPGVVAAEDVVLTEAGAGMFLDHIERSLLPLIWNGAGGDCLIDAGELSPLTRRLDLEAMPVSGIAFPVRLGALGNGYVAFHAGSLELTGDLVIDLHVRSFRIMTDLLALEEQAVLPAEGLSQRERVCLQLAGEGRISEEIAARLGLSVHTVNAHLGSATVKLNSVNRIQAIAKAIRLGYIH